MLGIPTRHSIEYRVGHHEGHFSLSGMGRFDFMWRPSCNSFHLAGQEERYARNSHSTLDPTRHSIEYRGDREPHILLPTEGGLEKPKGPTGAIDHPPIGGVGSTNRLTRYSIECRVDHLQSPLVSRRGCMSQAIERLRLHTDRCRRGGAAKRGLGVATIKSLKCVSPMGNFIETDPGDGIRAPHPFPKAPQRIPV